MLWCKFFRSLILMYIYSTAVGGVIEMRTLMKTQYSLVSLQCTFPLKLGVTYRGARTDCMVQNASVPTHMLLMALIQYHQMKSWVFFKVMWGEGKELYSLQARTYAIFDHAVPSRNEVWLCSACHVYVPFLFCDGPAHGRCSKYYLGLLQLVWWNHGILYFWKW